MKHTVRPAYEVIERVQPSPYTSGRRGLSGDKKKWGTKNPLTPEQTGV